MTCELLVDGDSKITWYSSDITVNLLKYFMGTGEGAQCTAPLGADPSPYAWGTPLAIGDIDEVTEENPVPAEGTLCLMKYVITNANDNHDLRVQIFRVGGPDDEEEDSAKYITSVLAVALLSLMAFII